MADGIFVAQNVARDQRSQIARFRVRLRLFVLGFKDGESRRHVVFELRQCFVDALHDDVVGFFLLDSGALVAVDDDRRFVRQFGVFQIFNQVFQLTVGAQQLAVVILPSFLFAVNFFFFRIGSVTAPRHRIFFQSAVFVVHIGIVRQVDMGEKHVFAFCRQNVLAQTGQNGRLTQRQGTRQGIADKGNGRRIKASFQLFISEIGELLTDRH